MSHNHATSLFALLFVGIGGCATDGSELGMGGQGGVGRAPTTTTGNAGGPGRTIPGTAGSAGMGGTAGNGPDSGGAANGGAASGGAADGGSANGGSANGGSNGGDGGDSADGDDLPDGSVGPDPDVGSCGTRDERDYGDCFTRPEVPDASVPMEPEDAGADGGVSSEPSPMGWPVAEENGLRLEVVFADMTQASQIGMNVDITNGTGDDISLDDVTFRYYYVAGFTPVINVDYSGINSGSGHEDTTGDVVPVVTPDYVEFGFDDDVTFPEGGVLHVHARIHSSDYQGAFDTCDSFSFDDAPATSTLDAYSYIPLYYQGDLVYGVQPVLAP